MFHLFTHLPPELRLTIWRIAYTEWTVKVVSPRHLDHRHRHRPGQDTALAIAQTCSEARHAVESYLNKIDLTIHDPERPSMRVHFPTTIFSFGPATEAFSALRWASDAACEGMSHVALIWTSHRGVRDCLQLLGDTSRFASIASVTVFLADGKYTNLSPRALADDDYRHLITSTADHHHHHHHRVTSTTAGATPRKSSSWSSSWTDIDKLTRLLSSWLGPPPRPPHFYGGGGESRPSPPCVHILPLS